jgi:hypothetical protein
LLLFQVFYKYLLNLELKNNTLKKINIIKNFID